MMTENLSRASLNDLRVGESLPLGKSFLPVDPPVSEPGIAQRVEGARKAGREECSVQILLALTHSGDPAENLLWGASTVFALAVGPVALLVVVLNPPFMNGHELGPALGPCEVPVGHPALDVEGGLYVRLPRTTPLYLFLVDVQGFVDRECLGLALKMAPPSLTMASGEP